MTLVQGWLPPTRENWELVCGIWNYFPLITVAQWVLDWYPQGKTSTTSIFNLPGRWAWMTMEAPGFMVLLYIMFTLPQQEGIASLPARNWVMAALFTIHYLYRAFLFPLLNPSMSPNHILVWSMAFFFQIFNGLSIGGWLAGYGPVSAADWRATTSLPLPLGLAIWAAGLVGNAYHDEILRAIRRDAAREQRQRAEEKARREGKSVDKVSVDKVYRIPEAGLFRHVLFAHYFCEWVEWAGFWTLGGLRCAPARSFLVNEITTMLPRALQGKRWYVKKFGKDKVGDRKAIIPGLL